MVNFRLPVLLGLAFVFSGCFTYQKSFLSRAGAWEDQHLTRFRPSLSRATAYAQVPVVPEGGGRINELGMYRQGDRSTIMTTVDASNILQPNLEQFPYDPSRPVRFEVDADALVYRTANGSYFFPMVWGISVGPTPLGVGNNHPPRITMPESTVVGHLAFEYVPKAHDFVLRAKRDGTDRNWDRNGLPVQHPGLRDLPHVAPFAPNYKGPWIWVGGSLGTEISGGQLPAEVPLEFPQRSLMPLTVSVLRDSTDREGQRTLEGVVLSESLYFALILPGGTQHSPRPPRIITALFRDNASLRSALVNGLTDADGYDLETGVNAWGFRPNGTRQDGAIYLGRFGPKGRVGRALSVAKNGERFVGSFKDDKEEGPGALFKPNGERVYGVWKHGVLQGGAIEQRAQGPSFALRFEQGKEVSRTPAPQAPANLGQGWVWLGGAAPEPAAIAGDGGDVLYEVTLQGNRITGASVRTSDGRAAAGTWGEGELVQGTVLNPSGSVYQGALASMQPHGRGNLTFSDGSMLDGEFSEGRPHGLMVEASPKGKLVEVRFFKGRKVMREGANDEEPMTESVLIAEVFGATQEFKKAIAKAEQGAWDGLFEALASVAVVATVATTQAVLARNEFASAGLNPLAAQQLSAQLNPLARAMPLQADLLARTQLDLALRQAGRMTLSRELLSPALRANHVRLASFVDNTPFLTADPFVVSPLALRGVQVDVHQAPLRQAWLVADYRLREQLAAGALGRTEVAVAPAPLASASRRAPAKAFEAATFVASVGPEVPPVPSAATRLPAAEPAPARGASGAEPVWYLAQKDAPLQVGYTLERIDKGQRKRVPLGGSEPAAAPAPDVFVLRLHLRPAAGAAENCRAPECKGFSFVGVAALPDGSRKTIRVFWPRTFREPFRYPEPLSVAALPDTGFVRSSWSERYSMPVWIDARQPGTENPIAPMATCAGTLRAQQRSACAGYEDGPVVTAQ